MPAPRTVLDTVAAYDAHVGVYIATNEQLVAEQADTFLTGLAAGSLILDAGCGPGRDLVRFAEAGHLPVGFDLSAGFTAVARTAGPVCRADLTCVPFPDATFDAVWACASLVHLDAAGAVVTLGELRRVAKPGAALYVSVKIDGFTGWQDSRYGLRWFHIWDLDVFAAAVEAAGFLVLSAVRCGQFVDVFAVAGLVRQVDAPG